MTLWRWAAGLLGCWWHVSKRWMPSAPGPGGCHAQADPRPLLRPPAVITAVVSTESFDADYTYVVDFSGYVPIWFNDKIDFNRPPGQGSDFHWLWFVPVQVIQRQPCSCLCH